jgi:phosphoribosyl-ATP pyrophosphohydrolase/phosphoribosyl-AMP cyclohydrolase/histidinol dehydrogenase
MDTTLPLPFLPSVDLAKGPSESKEGLKRNQLSFLGCVHFAATTSTVDTLLQFLQRHVSIEAYVDVTGIESIEDIVTILDAGARKVFATAAQLESLKIYGDRVVSVLSTQDESPSTTAYSNGVLYDIGDLSLARSTLERLKNSKASPIFLASAPSDLEALVKLATEFSAIPIIPAAKLTIEKGSQGQISVPELIAASWSSDRADKLIPTVVTDERGIALGLVYSSQESLVESLKTGTGVYQSRKRGLWYKGATSGDTQELVRVSLDCDQDCLKFTVRQQGRGRFSHHGLVENFLMRDRILPPPSINMFRRTSRYFEARKDLGFTESLGTGRIIYCTSIL